MKDEAATASDAATENATLFTQNFRFCPSWRSIMSQACCLSPQEERICSHHVSRKGHERVFAIRDRVQFDIPHIDIERARYFTESMRETEGQLLTLRWAKAMKNVAEKITVYIDEGSLLAGRAGCLGRHGILYPELDGDFYREVLAGINSRKTNPFRISDEDVRIALEDIAPYWEGKTFHEHLNAALPPELRKLTYSDDRGLKSKSIVNETASYRSGLQWCPDYEKAIRKGFLGLKKEIEEKLSSLDLENALDISTKKPFLEAMLVICDAIMIWGRRHADLARKLAAGEADPVRRKELLRIAEICDHVPAHPARTFHEALQCQWFVQIFSRLEQRTGGVVSNGRMDQYLYPFYKKDMEDGILTREQAKELLECMWVEMAQFVDFNISPSGSDFYEGYAHWEAVTIGGQTRDGEDATNELSYLFLESKREFPLNYPDLAARIHSRSPERFLHEVALTIKDGSGYPKLINDEETIPLNALKGVPLAEVYDYAVSGCTETRYPNRDTYTSGCAYINFAAALEMTMYNGRMPYYGDELLGLETGDPLTFRTWEEFYDAYKKQHVHLIRRSFQQQAVVDRLRPEHFASPLSSCLHDLCMNAMTDLQSERIEGGVDFSYFEMLGYATVVDSLAAVKKLVFEEKVVSMEELLRACRADFKGYEPLREQLLHAPAFGNDDPYADAIAKDLDRLSLEEADRSSKERGLNAELRFVPITSHITFGNVIGATPNGRTAGTSLSDGASPSQGADHEGPTAVLLSSYHSKNYDMLHRASRLLNIKLSPKSVAGEEGTRKIVDLIRTWCDLKLWHLQFNIINRETLLKAQKTPENYRGLLVRVAGYSAYFCDRSPALQNDIIERTESEQV